MYLLRVKNQDSDMSIERYGCLKDVSETCMKNLCLLRVKTQDFFLTAFVRYECQKDVAENSCVF